MLGAFLASLVLSGAGVSLAGQAEEGAWRKDIFLFEKELRRILATASIPSEEEFKARFGKEGGGLEVITDGGGGVVDFAAPKGTIQHVANKAFRHARIDWEFELANDTSIAWNKSTDLVPACAMTGKKTPRGEPIPTFGISIAKTNAGPFATGDRIRLRATIDDFSRFTEGFSKARGVVVVHYLEGVPHPVFFLQLEGAEVSLVKPGPAKRER